MGEPRALADLPPGFRIQRDACTILVVRRELDEELARAGFGLGLGPELSESDARGRRPLHELEVSGRRVLVRRFHHGGFLGGLLGERYLGPGRVFSELVDSARLAEAGLATPHVLAARARRSASFGWTLELATERIAGVWDGGEALERLRRGEVASRPRARLLGALGGLVGSLHRVGYLHPDLHPKNVLIESELLEELGLDQHAPRTWILDLDRGRFLARVSDGQRRAVLERLWRGARKLERRGPPFLRRTDARRFLAGYTRALALEPGSWKAEWRAVEKKSRRGAWRHALGRLLGAS